MNIKSFRPYLAGNHSRSKNCVLENVDNLSQYQRGLYFTPRTNIFCQDSTTLLPCGQKLLAVPYLYEEAAGSAIVAPSDNRAQRCSSIAAPQSADSDTEQLIVSPLR